MHETGVVNPAPLNPAQAVALAELVELEARWENLRHKPTPKDGPLPREELLRKQMAHDAFHGIKVESATINMAGHGSDITPGKNEQQPERDNAANNPEVAEGHRQNHRSHAG